MESNCYDVVIIGAGLTGLSTAAFLLQRQPDARILILEQSGRAGGAIQSYHQDGYLAEWGPHGFLDNCEESRELVALAGLEQAKVTAPLGTFVRYICLQGRLQCIPQRPGLILRAPLIPFAAKLRVLADLWKKPLGGEPTVADWVSHRFGPALLPFADAVFTGTYAGDFNRLIIDAVMPGLRKMEQEHGSVLRGAVQAMRARKAQKGREARGLPAMTSFTQGMGMLPEHLETYLRSQTTLVYGCAAHTLTRLTDSWQVQAAERTYQGRQLVVALPVNQSLKLLPAALASSPPPLAAIPDARIFSVLLGFDRSARIPFGFGYLAPEQERRFALGALFSTHMFPGRAPQGNQMLEALVGGRRHPERLELSDTELIEGVLADLKGLMDLPPKPAFATVLRPSSGIPQMEAGYTDLLKWRQTLCRTHTHLHVCGFGWQGIGMNDMVKEAKMVATRIITEQQIAVPSAVKGVYF